MDVPASSDGDETISLVELLAVRDGYLTEEELWAFCKECCLTLDYIEGSHDLCQSLCLSPDTLAFDHTGCVCFLDLDIDPDPVYIPPEYEDSSSTVKSHLFSVGMSMLYAVKYSSETNNPRPMLGSTITDLLGKLTCDEYTKRPDLGDVISWCDEALQGKSSQDVCLNLWTEFMHSGSLQGGSSIVELTSGLSAYLQSQSGLVTSAEFDPSDTSDPCAVQPRSEHESHNHPHTMVNCLSLEKLLSDDNKTVDVCVAETGGTVPDSRSDGSVDIVTPYVVKVNASYSTKGNSLEEKKRTEDCAKQSSKKKEGMTVNDLLDILDRYLEEQELWALCKEGVMALQRKKKHLPAYISPDTVVVRDDGTLSFKPIPEDKPLEVVFMAPELQQKGILSEQTCLYGLGMTLRSAAGQKYSTSLMLHIGQKFENLLVAMLQNNAEKRPTLLETLDVCSELECSVKAHPSTDICKAIYEAAITELVSPAQHHEEDESELLQLYEQNKDKHENPAELEHPRSSTDHTNVDSPWDESFTSSSDFQPITSTLSAFKRLPGTPTKPQLITSMGTALTPLVPTKTLVNKSAVPSAFSSPSTHFKPIVLQAEVNLKTDEAQSPEKKKDVMKKLEDLKQDLLKRKSGYDVTDSEKSKDKSNVSKESEVTSKKSEVDNRTLERLLSKLQSDGQMPNTKVLASAIAQYLQGHIEPQEQNPSESSQQGPSSSELASHIVYSQASNTLNTIPQTTSMISHNPGESSQSVYSQASSSFNVIPQEKYLTDHNPDQRHSQGVLSLASNIFNSIPQTTNLIGENVGQGTSFPIVSSEVSNTCNPIAETTNLIGQNPVQRGSSQGVSLQDGSTFNSIPQTTHLIGQNTGQIAPQDILSQGSNSYHTFPQTTNLIGQNQVEGSTTHIYHMSNLAQYQPHSMIPGVNLPITGQPPVMNQTLNIPFQYGNSILPSYPMQLHQDPLTGLMHLIPVNFMPYGGVPGHVPEPYTAAVTSLDRRIDDDKSVSDSDRSSRNKQKEISSVYSYSSTSECGYPSPTAVNHLPNSSRNQSRNSNRSHSSQLCSSMHSDSHSITSGDDGQSHFTRMRPENDRPNSHHFALPRKSPQQNDWKGRSQNGLQNMSNYKDSLSIKSNNDSKYLSAERASSNCERCTNDGVKNNSASSSPSPSKDSGVSGLNVLTHVHGLQNTDISLMDRLLSTENLEQQRMLGRVLQLIQEECHLERYSTDDLAIAEYITSLGDLKWETFTSAVTEKYPDQCWDQDLVGRLYQIVNDSRSHPADKYVVKTPISTEIKTDDSQGWQSPPSNGDKKSLPSDGDKKKHQRTNSAPGFVVDHSFNSNSFCSTSAYRGRRPSEGSALAALHHSASPYHSEQLSEDGELTTPHTSHNNHLSRTSKYPSETSSMDHEITKQTHPPDVTGPQANHHEARTHIEPLDRPSYLSPSRHHYESINRPQSVCHNRLCAWTSETSDSTDTERLEKRRRFKKRYELDRAKSSSMHSLTRNSVAVAHMDAEVDNEQFLSDGTLHVNGFNRVGQNERYLSKPDRVSLQMSETHGIDGTNRNQDSLTRNQDISNRNQDISNKNQESSNRNQESSNRNENENNTQTTLSHNRLSLPNNSAVLQVAHNSAHRHNKHSEGYTQEIPSPRLTSIACEEGYDIHTNSTDMWPVRSQRTMNASRQKGAYERADHGRGKNISTFINKTPTPVSAFPRNRPPQHPIHEQSMPLSFTHSHTRPQQHGSDSFLATHTSGTTLVRYQKKDKVVYHWAMTQLHEIQEISNFLHTIEHDEENKDRLEKRLRQTQQEIDLVQKERRKTQKLYHKMTEPSKSPNKAEQTTVSGQMLKDLSEMTKNLRFLTLCKTHLQLLLCELYGLDECFLYSLAASLPSQPLILRPYESNPALQFQSVNKTDIGCNVRVLQAGECEGLLAYLYVSSALSDGYVHQFLYCFRYFVTAEQVLQFILDKYTGSQKGSSSDKNLVRIRHRSLDLLSFWVEGFYKIDFELNSPLISELQTFLNNKVNLSEELRSNELLSLLEWCHTGHSLELCSADDYEEESASYFIHLTPSKKSSEERLMEWDSFRSNKRAKMAPKIMKEISTADTKIIDQFKMAASLMDLTPVSMSQRSDNFIIADYSPATLVEQLTLLEQEMFQQTHPVHYLNSKAHGVGVALSMQGQRTPLLPRKKDDPIPHNLFLIDPPLDPVVHRWIKYNQSISHWVAAEIIVCISVKSQIAVLSKFIQVARLSADVRNFATCLAVLEGLENLIVRQLPVWKSLSSKCVTTMDELATLKMQLKSDPAALIKEKDSYLLPTIPYVLYFLLHVQQLEIGGFRLANGMFKWSKMRAISQMIDMIRLFRDSEYLFERDSELLGLIRGRIQEFSNQDLHAIAANSDINIQKVGSKGFHGALRKIKDKLQSKGSK